MPALAHCIIFVSDMSRSVRFYRDTLGLTLKFESPHWSEFASSGATLALHLGGSSAPPDVTVRPAHSATCQPGFTVDDVDATHARLTAAGVRCLRPPKQEDFGAKMAAYADPDGLPFTVAGPHHSG